MQKAPTLADAFLRESFKPYYKHIDPERKLPWMVAQAHKFVLDEDMSAFMADLAWASLLTVQGNEPAAYRLLDGMRSLARLPHKITWIEYLGGPKAARAKNEYGSPASPELTPERLGWLCWQHDSIETAFGALEFVSHTVPLGQTVPNLYQPQPYAFGYGWRSDDQEALPWRSHIDVQDEVGNVHCASQILIGVKEYKSSRVAIIPNPAGDGLLKAQARAGVFDLAGEIAGDLRYLWALLATINDLPVTFTDVRASKGYVARGRYRKFSDHRVINLKVPAARYRRIAARAIAVSRRRAHEVRGHWRRDYRHEGERVWVREHTRGDASLGWVRHDYAVTRNTEANEGG